MGAPTFQSASERLAEHLPWARRPPGRHRPPPNLPAGWKAGAPMLDAPMPTLRRRRSDTGTPSQVDLFALAISLILLRKNLANRLITLDYRITDDMLQYGFDFTNDLSVQLDASKSGFEINSTSGPRLTSSSAALTYDIKARMPLLTELARLNDTGLDTTSSYETADDTIGQYQTFEFTTSGGSANTYYGLQLRYLFDEDVSAVGADSTATYSITSDSNNPGYYLDGAINQMANLLDYTFGGPDTRKLPETTNSTTVNGYAPLVTNGSLIQSSNVDITDLADAWYHLAYLSLDSDDFINEVSDHNFTVRSHSDYITGVTNIPEIFGRISKISSSDFEGTYFFDEHGNPARVDSDWFSSSTTPGQLELAFDSLQPELLSVNALSVDDIDSTNIGYDDDYIGSFTSDDNNATFSFNLVFNKELNPDDINQALVWTINATHNTTDAAVDPADLTTESVVSAAVEQTNTLGESNYTYQVSNSVSGLFDTSGSYSILFDEDNDLADTTGLTMNADAANTTLTANTTTNCYLGTCSFTNTPLTLTGFTVDPGLALATTGDTSASDEFNLTLTFSEPVYFAPDDQAENDPDLTRAAFEMEYYVLGNSNAVVQSGDGTGQAQYTDTISGAIEGIINGDQIVGGDPSRAYYTEFVIPFKDDIQLWARSDYDTDIGGSSDVFIYFAADTITATSRSTDTNAVLNINYLHNFFSIDGTIATITSIDSNINDDTTDIFMVDPEDNDNVITKLKFSLVDQIPVVNSITAVAASSSNRQNDDASSVKRHVEFQINDLDQQVGDGVGVLFLFRTTDDAFTNNDPNTAPYYGAEGGIYISGTDIDSGGTGYHICPPFSKHLDRIGTGMQYAGTPTYNANRLKIHYLPIPYAGNSEVYIYDDAEIAAVAPVTIDFTGSLAVTEPCVRTTFYNDGVGQYGYIVDSDQEEQHMVIANAMLQDQSGDTADLGMLPAGQLGNVYFDLYSKDYTADSWRRDQRLTAQDLIKELTAANLNNSSLHNDDSGISYQIDSTYLSIFASRFVNSINARFLDSVFLDDLTLADIPAHSYDWKDKHADLLSHSAFDNVSASNKTANQYSNIYAEDDYFTPNYRNQTPDALVNVNDNRLVLSIGVHPAAIQVDAGSGLFNPFETEQANFLKMDPAFYGLYYGGVANTTEPGFDYTSRHLAYVNFDLVYELNIDPDTQEITGATLVQIVSPFTLLKHSFFSQSELQDRDDNGETYTAVAASIADNVFRHNFTGVNSNDAVQHFLPYGVYCYNHINTSSSCYNADAQMLLPDPNDSANGYQRTEPSPHNLHRGVLYLENTTEYSTNGASNDTLGSGGSTLLERFMRLQSTADTGGNEGRINATDNPAAPGAIGNNAYTSMLYNSFDRDHAFDYTYNASSEDFGQTYSSDGNYSSSPYEQEYWGVAPFAESPDARADQILPNAFFMGGQSGYYFHTFINHPYQYSSFVQKIHSALGDADDLIDKNIFPRGLDSYINSSNDDISWNPSFDTYASFIFPNDAEVLSGNRIYMAQSSVSSSTYMADNYGDYEFDDYGDMYSRHIISTSPHTHEYINYFDPYDNNAYEQHVIRKMHSPSYYSGRNIGYLTRDTYYANNRTYALSENFFARAMTNNGIGNAFIYRSDQGSRPINNRDFGVTYGSNSSADGEYHYAALNTDFFYTPGATNNGTSNNNIQRMFLPHHEDDFDFDRGQIMANKLGFFVDTGVIMDIYDVSPNNDEYAAYAYSRLFFPSDPAAITSETSTMDPIASHPFSSAYGNEVANYYPLVLANESLHTTSGTWPMLLTEYSGHSQTRSLVDQTRDYAWYLDGISGQVSNDRFALNVTDERYQRAVFPIALDKIFPEGYRYQLGFVNREELFMYDPTWDGSGEPVINRFYASAVGHFGYATQYSRLNRRSMQGYHLGTSSQFLGDHLARFSSTPAAGVHTPGEVGDVFGHTPVEQGATGTNYGSYAEGYYNLNTTAGTSTGTWRSVAYSGTLRGYVLELRTNPVEQHYFEEKTEIADWADMPGRSHNETPGDLDNLVTTMQNLEGGIHPEGDF